MKILYFGTVCDRNSYERLLHNCNNKPSIAPLVFESALLEGMKANAADVEIYSFPMIPVFPHSKVLSVFRHEEILPCGYMCKWLNTINVPVLKQLSRCFDAKRILKRWGKANKGEGIIFSYSIPPFLVKDIIKYGKKYRVSTVAIIPDLLIDMYINESENILTKLKNCYLKPALRLQAEYDGYIYLTEAMRDVVAPKKPYIVMEGIADISSVSLPRVEEKSSRRAIMYAGMLHEKYGINNLINAFESLSFDDVELWLFGNGTAVPLIKEKAANDYRIKYFGMVSRAEILEYERKATILVNPRDPKEEFTYYSFPSKTIEYMLSGTPMITTKLKGIPNEYLKYMFVSEDNSVSELASTISNALQHSMFELNEIGVRAQEFIVSEKNSQKQVARILEFFKEVKNVSGIRFKQN